MYRPNLSVPSVDRTKNTYPDKGGEIPVGVVAENRTSIWKLVYRTKWLPRIRPINQHIRLIRAIRAKLVNACLPISPSLTINFRGSLLLEEWLDLDWGVLDPVAITTRSLLPAPYSAAACCTCRSLHVPLRTPRT